MNLFSKCSNLSKFVRTRHFGTVSPIQASKKIQAWQIHSYNDPIQLSEIRSPIIKNADELLIQVEAASVNPLDILMSGGYGSELIGLLRKTNESVPFPITLGRDFSGRILSKGLGVPSEFEIGQKVCGVVPVHMQGSHAENLVIPHCVATKSPGNVSSVECASVMYAGVTAWCALWVFGGLLFQPIRGKRVLVLGASGGVGSMAVQLLKSEGAVVIATCSTDAIPNLSTLGVDLAIDYKTSSYEQDVKLNGPYEIILDCAGYGSDIYVNNDWSCKSFVTLSSPILKNADKLGLTRGMFQTAAEFVLPNIQALQKGSTVRWAYFMPLQQGVSHVRKMVENGQLVPVVQQVFGFNELSKAYEVVSAGHLRGKIVVDMLNKGP